MDITFGEFEEFGSRSSRPSTRSSLRTDTMSSMEILPPEENTEHLFMSEELDSEDDAGGTITPLSSSSASRQSSRLGLSDNSEGSNKRASQEKKKDERNESRNSSEMIETLFPDIDDPKLREAIKKMRKYDKILMKKIKREKEVKRQRLLFQKQLIVQLSTPEPVKDEATANTMKYLALMPPSEKLEELLGQVDADEFTPIFPTQISAEDHEPKSPSSHTFASDKPSAKEDVSATTDDSETETGAKKSHKSKTDFIKRNIELAKDAGSLVSMTDDEKKRLNELLADLDALELLDSEGDDNAFTTLAMQAGEGYTPSEEGQRRLAEIDEQIKFLMPPTDTEEITGYSRFPKLDIRPIVIANTDPGDDGGDRLRMIEDKLNSLDDEWRDLYEGTGPRLTDAALQKLLSECGCSSRLSSRFSLTPNSSVRATPRVESSVSSEPDTPDFDVASESDTLSEYSAAHPLSRETLNSLLAEARSSLGISNTDDNDDRTGIFSGETTPTPSSGDEEYANSLLFLSSSKERPDSGGSGTSDLSVEDLEDSGT